VGLFLVVLIAIAFYLFKYADKPANKAHQKPEPEALTASQKRYPILRADMILPVDQPIPTVKAIQIYKEFMLKVGYLEKYELAWHADEFAESMRRRTDELADDVRYETECLDTASADTKQQIANLKHQYSQATDPDERECINDEIDDLKQELTPDDSDLKAAKKTLQSFRRDKRQFLIDYVNRETHPPKI